ncbi:MAG: SEC-C metal-binding domain-containing protein [Streptosporangiaceae bacterium]
MTLDRICREQARGDETIRGRLEASGRPLRSSAEHLSDDELLEKLCGFGFDLDRGSLEKLCEGVLSAEEVARRLLDKSGIADSSESDWIWICLVSLWQRWWPDKVCLELLDDKVQAGYAEDEQNNASACTATWLDAWSDVLRLCDATGIGSIEEFDDRFPMTQSLYNWSQDLELALWNAGLDDRDLLLICIEVCEEALRRFPREDQLMTENRRRVLGESYFESGMTEKAEELFQSRLAADAGWGWGWIGWADCYTARVGRPGNHARAEELLRRGYSAPGVRDRDCIAERLRDLCLETGRPGEAGEFGRQARRLRRRPPTVTVSRRLDLADDDDGPAAVRETTTMDFGSEGLPLDRFPDVIRALTVQSSGPPARAVKVGRNAPCPCGSGKKFKKCCGSPLHRDSCGRDARHRLPDTPGAQGRSPASA